VYVSEIIPTHMSLQLI